MEVVVGGEGGVVLDDEVEVREVEAAGGDIGGDEEGRRSRCAEGVGYGGADLLGEGAMESVDLERLGSWGG